MPNSLSLFREALNLTQKDFGRLIGISRGLVAYTESKNQELNPRTEGFRNLNRAEGLLIEIEPLPEEPEAEPDGKPIRKEIKDLEMSLYRRQKELEKSARIYQAARRKAAFVIAFRQKPEAVARKLTSLLQKLETEAHLEMEAHNPVLQKNLRLKITSLQMQLDFWKGELPG
jgi:transcriptional regulator with XRE-family HTH domain